MIGVVTLCYVTELRATTQGVLLALASGCIASALGYVIWYRALAYLSATRAAIVQLSAPVIAAVGGVLLLGETFSMRLGIASACVFSGVTLAVTSKARRAWAQNRN